MVLQFSHCYMCRQLQVQWWSSWLNPKSSQVKWWSKNPSELNITRSSFNKSRCRLFVRNQYKTEHKPLLKLEVLFVYRPFVFQCISLKLPGVIWKGFSAAESREILCFPGFCAAHLLSVSVLNPACLVIIFSRVLQRECRAVAFRIFPSSSTAQKSWC